MPRRFIKFTEEQDGRIKILSTDKPVIRELYSLGFSSRKLGKMYGVSHTAILYAVNDDFKAKMNARTKKNEKRGYKELKEALEKTVAKKVRMGLVTKYNARRSSGGD